jgi:peptidoglycan/xylan/chitin deacetylase (PgdA/CDA1 family)
MEKTAPSGDKNAGTVSGKKHPLKKKESLRGKGLGNLVFEFLRWVRGGLAYCLYFSGFLSLILRIRLRKKAVVLMYHRVLTDEEYSRNFFMGGIAVRTRTFEKQIEYLRRNFRILSPKEFISRLEREALFETKSCLVTFDDGWKDNFLNAYPILKENRTPALIFLPTDFIGSFRCFWQEELADLLVAARKRCREDKGFATRNKTLFNIEGLRDIMASDEKRLPQEIAAFLGVEKEKSVSEIEKLIYSLKQALPAETMQEKKEAVFLSWDEVKIMARDGIDFGSHGKSHVILPAVDTREAEREIRESKEILEKNLGQKVDAFSYPNGDCDASVAKAVQDQGYRVAFGTEQGFVCPGADPFRIRRVNIHQDMTGSIPMFLARIVGLC